MEETKEQLIEKVKTLLDTQDGVDKEWLTEELGKLVPKTEAVEDAGDTERLSEALSKMKVSHITKLRKFSKGENFAQFCERFQNFVYITKMQDTNLHLYFLQQLDEESYATLSHVPLTDEQKRDATRFCEVYKDTIYGSDVIPLRNELLECKQLVNEDMAEFAYRLREKASRAFTDEDNCDMNCLLALMRGVRDEEIRRKLNESEVTNFNDALKLAKKLEKVDIMIRGKPDTTSILKNAPVTSTPEEGRQKSEISENGSRARDSLSIEDGRRSRPREGSYSYSRGWNASTEDSRDRSRDWERDSRDRQQFPRNRNSTPNYRSRGRQFTNKVCNFCRRRGHVQRWCWQRNKARLPTNRAFRNNRSSGMSHTRDTWHLN